MNTFNISLLNRDFSMLPLKPLSFQVDRLTWSAFGGCDQAVISAYAPIDKLFAYVSLLRCPILVSDISALPVWWGFVNEITVYYEYSKFTMNLDNLYNRVNLKYSFLSPDNKLADQYETGFRANQLSVSEYGNKEKVIFRHNIEEQFAENLRDTFLELSAYPRSILSSSHNFTNPKIVFNCKGWFHTLSWQSYEHLDGFYANYGPGPGFVPVGSSTHTAVAQPFTVTHHQQVKYVYFYIHRFSGPTNNLIAHIYSDSGSATPKSNLGSSLPFNGSVLNQQKYTWVKFTFPNPVQLTANTMYWAYLDTDSTSSTKYYQLHADETSSFNQFGHAAKVKKSGSWTYLTNMTTPAIAPDLYFRVISVEDTGQTLKDIATVGSQFFTAISSLTTGVSSCPYRYEGYSCQEELIRLMRLGTSNNRLILAEVTPERRLFFYEQPDPAQPVVLMNSKGQFFTNRMQILPPWRPPIGQFAQLSSVSRLVQPFDKIRTPSYFVDKFDYRPSREGAP